MLLLLDNYDSFTYNLYQMLGTLGGSGADIRVLRNDALAVSDVEDIAPSQIVISPGPGRPAEAGISEELIRRFAGRVPILGVCLGHQAICEVFGATIDYAPQLMHGKASEVVLAEGARLFAGLPERVQVGRYHSLVADVATIPDCLRVTAQTAEGTVMAVEHREFAVYGMQFHPESILTPQGRQILANFLNVTEGRGGADGRGGTGTGDTGGTRGAKSASSSTGILKGAN
jgi:anthranilate synthase component 2